MNEIHPIALWRNKCDVNVCVWEYVYVDLYLYCVNGFDRLTMEVENCGFASKIFGLDGVEANREVGNGKRKASNSSRRRRQCWYVETTRRVGVVLVSEHLTSVSIWFYECQGSNQIDQIKSNILRIRTHSHTSSCTSQLANISIRMG